MATNTAASFTNHTGNGTAGPFNISFSYLAESEVDVTVGGVLKTITTHYTFTSATQITFTSGNEPGNGVAIKFQRDTDISAKKVDFADGSVLTETDLDTQNDQVLFAQQEILDKLSGIEENATADQTNAEIKTAYEANSDTNAFTDAEKTKLSSIEASATADQSASEIKTAYESNSDTNAFTDAEKTKLTSVESNATADQTASEIKTAYEANSDTNAFTDAEKTKLSGISTGAEVNVQSDFNATSGDAVILNKPTIPSALNDLSDVNTTGAADGKILKFQSSSNTFIIADDANDGGGGGGGSLTDGDKGDITVSSSGASWSIDASAVSTNKIADDAVTQAKIADDAVGADQLAASAVVTGSIVDDAVTQAKVADNAIGADQIAANAVGASELADNAVDEAAIADDAVTRDKINAVSTSSLPSFEAKGTSGSTEGYIQLNCAENSHGIKLKSPPHSAGASYTFTFPQNIQNGQFLTTDANGNTSWSAIDLTALSASNLTSGTVPDARFPATLPAASAANLTSIPAANITGTLPAIDGSNLTGISTTPADGSITQAKLNFPVANRNLIINGAMQVAQRGTSSTTSGYGDLDRWKHEYGTVNENPTFAQVSLTSSDTPYTFGLTKATKITNGNQTSGLQAGSIINFMQPIEAQDIRNSGWNYTSSSSYITLSFWVRASVAQNYHGFIKTADGTNYSYPFELGSLSANTWTKITKTIPGNSNLQIDDDTGAGLQIFPITFLGTDYTGNSITNDAWMTWTSSTRTKDQTATWFTTNDATFEITGVQLEVGSVATDFEHRSLAVEKSLCSRYCQVMTSNATGERINFANVVVHGEGNGVYIMVGLLPMRSAPSVTTTGSFSASVLTGSWSTTAISSITSEFTTNNGNDRGTWGYDGMLAASIADTCTVGLSGQIFSSSGFGQFVFSAEL